MLGSFPALTMITLGIILALACAFVANLAFFLKHRGVCESPAVDVRHPWKTTKALWSSKWFALGMLAAACAWIIHVAALAVAPITVVQMALAAGLVMIGVIADRIFGFAVGPRQWWGLGLTTLGLIVVALTFPAGGEGAHSSYSAPTMAVFEAVLFAIGGLFILGPRIGAPSQHHGVMLGAAAGVMFGVSAVSIKALTGIAADGLLPLLVSPWLAVTVLASIAAFFSSARGLQDGEPVAVIAITGVATNITTIASGMIVFGDPLPGSTLGIVVHAAALLLILVAAALTPTGQQADATAVARA